MNFYANDLSLYDFASFSDPIFDPISLSQLHHHPLRRSSSSTSTTSFGEGDRGGGSNKSSEKSTVVKPPKSPTRHRHDGTSPLPLGMDWSLPPSKWNGQDTAWPHDPHTGWSYCVTIPSWDLQPRPGGSDPVVFYRVQVGIQSPEGITTIRGVLRRFSDFLKLLSDLKKEFPKKSLPPPPPKRILKMKNASLLEERRANLEGWMERVLSDIDISRSAVIGTFLELEAAARSSFDDADLQEPEGCLSVRSDKGSVSPDVTSEIGPTGIVRENMGSVPKLENESLDGYSQRLSTESISSDSNSVLVGGMSNFGVGNSLACDSMDCSGVVEAPTSSTSLMAREVLVAFPSDERQKLSRVLNNVQQRLAIAKTDMEDLITRLNQEMAVKQFLTTKVKDLELDLETTRNSCKENIQLATLNEKERLTQMQWDLEELRRQCLELELKLKSEQEEKAHVESAKTAIIQENKLLLHQLEVAKEELDNLHTSHEELELKSKADLKLLVKEVKSLRGSQSELKEELGHLLKEKIEAERTIQKEKQRTESVTAANAKLLHECDILRNRLQECSVNFLIEEEDKLTVDASTPSDAIDLLTTSDNRIGLLLAEAQLLAQDVETSIAKLDGGSNVNGSDQTDDKMRKMLTEIFVDNARLRMQVNSVIRCALNAVVKTDKDEDEESETPQGKTVLSKFF